AAQVSTHGNFRQVAAQSVQGGCMKRSKDETGQTRLEIVEADSRLFRERGLGGVSVADVMGEVGLTVGGFYRRFASKEALVAEAIAAASRATVPEGADAA